MPFSRLPGNPFCSLPPCLFFACHHPPSILRCRRQLPRRISVEPSTSTRLPKSPADQPPTPIPLNFAHKYSRMRTTLSPLEHLPFQLCRKVGDEFRRLDRNIGCLLNIYAWLCGVRTPAIFCGRNRGNHARLAVSGFQFVPASSRLGPPVNHFVAPLNAFCDGASVCWRDGGGDEI